MRTHANHSAVEVLLTEQKQQLAKKKVHVRDNTRERKGASSVVVVVVVVIAFCFIYIRERTYAELSFPSEKARI